MTGLTDTDIRLDDNWQLTQATDGDAPICTGLDCLYQNIKLEAVTQPGDLFYDDTFGWGLYDFIQAEDDELTRLEIMQRVKTGLQKREIIIPDSIQINIEFEDDTFQVYAHFRFSGEETARNLNIVIDTVNVEVATV